MEPIDKQFHDKIAAKVYSATKQDREKQTAVLTEKMDEIKSTGEVKVMELPASLLEQAAEWTAAAQFVKALSSALSLKGDKGEQGEQGTPGEQGAQGLPGKDGKDGKDGTDGRDGVGKDGIDGKDGKDGSPDTADQIVEKLSTLKNAWLEVTSIKGFEQYMGEFGANFLTQAKSFVPRTLDSLYDVAARGTIADGQSLVWNKATQKWIPGSASVGGMTPLTVTGTVDGANQVFTVASLPSVVVVDGAWLQAKDNNNVTQWTYSGTTLTLSTSPPINAIFSYA